MCKIRKEVKELNIVLCYLKLKGLIIIKLITVK